MKSKTKSSDNDGISQGILALVAIARRAIAAERLATQEVIGDVLSEVAKSGAARLQRRVAVGTLTGRLIECDQAEQFLLHDCVPLLELMRQPTVDFVHVAKGSIPHMAEAPGHLECVCEASPVFKDTRGYWDCCFEVGWRGEIHKGIACCWPRLDGTLGRPPKISQWLDGVVCDWILGLSSEQMVAVVGCIEEACLAAIAAAGK